MRWRSTMPAALITLLPASYAGVACAQSSYMAPDNKNRFPGVTIFCPNGDGVMPCNFAAGASGSGTVALSTGGTLVSPAHTLPVGDVLMDALINSGALTVSGSVKLSAGTNAIGTVSVGNFPATQPISGAVSEAGSWTVICSNCGGTGGGSAATTLAASASPPFYSAGLQAGSMDLSGAMRTRPTVGGNDLVAWPTSQSGAWTVAVSALPALPAGTNGIGAVIVSNLPVTQAVSGAVSQAGTWSVGVASLPALPAGGNAIGSVTVSNLPVTQAVSAASLPLPGGAAIASLQPTLNTDGGGLAHVTNFPAVQPISGALSQSGSWIVGVSALPPLPAGTNNIGAVSVANFPATQPVSSATNAPVAPGSATATASTLHGCIYNVSPPSFTNGQQGAVQCDSGGHLIPGAPVQQSMQPEAPVSVPAGTSTLLWTASAAARTLKIIPESQNTSCRLSDTGAAATSANGFVIPSGYVWNLIEPPPTTNIYAYCTSAAVIDVSQGN